MTVQAIGKCIISAIIGSLIGAGITNAIAHLIFSLIDNDFIALVLFTGLMILVFFAFLAFAVFMSTII